MTDIKQKSEENPYVMYILVNSDLSMSKGKIAGQVGHVVGVITAELFKNVYENSTKEYLDDFFHYENWVKDNMYTKVILKAKESELKKFIATESKCRYIIDAGRTQIPSNSLTVVGFFPRNDLAEKFKNFKLL
jgi:PTH2 family peptidyl-tRNA hydrolase